MTKRAPRSRTGAHRASIRDVAAQAGVSAQTVSRVLTGYPHVSPEMRRRVQEAIDAIGYHPNQNARALATGRTRSIGLLTLEDVAGAHGVVEASMSLAARDARYRVSSVTIRSMDPDDVAEALKQLHSSGAEGIIFAVPILAMSDEVERLMSMVPLVAIDAAPSVDTHVVSTDQVAIGRLATQHLLGLGHRTVHLISGPQDWADSIGRVQGWRATLDEVRAEIPEILVGDWSPTTAYEHGRQLAARDDVTAVFVASDEMAFGVLHGLSDAGRCVPEDVSVVGVDDIPVAQHANPPLTTVRQPFREVGALAVRRLLALIERSLGEPAEGICEKTLLNPELVIRNSTAAPRLA